MCLYVYVFFYFHFIIRSFTFTFGLADAKNEEKKRSSLNFNFKCRTTYRICVTFFSSLKKERKGKTWKFCEKRYPKHRFIWDIEGKKANNQDAQALRKFTFKNWECISPGNRLRPSKHRVLTPYKPVAVSQSVSEWESENELMLLFLFFCAQNELHDGVTGYGGEM